MSNNKNVIKLKKKYNGKLCRYCGHVMLYRKGIPTRDKPSRDHVEPRSDINRDKEKNVIFIVCGGCNADKANMRLLEWYMSLEEAGDPRTKVLGLFIKTLPEDLI